MNQNKSLLFSLFIMFITAAGLFILFFQREHLTLVDYGFMLVIAGNALLIEQKMRKHE